MADDGMLMNWEISDAPILPKASHEGNWKEKRAAKRGARFLANQGPKGPAHREIFKESRHNTAVEEYVGPEPSAPPPPKRQRIENNWEKNASQAKVMTGKLPPGSITLGVRKSTKFADETTPQNTHNQGVTETRPEFISGKLPPGSINVGGSKSKKFDDDDGKQTTAFVSGKLPPGSIGNGGSKAKKFGNDDNEPAISQVARKTPRQDSTSYDDYGGNYTQSSYGAKSAKAQSNSSGSTRKPESAKPPQHISSLFSFNPSSKTQIEAPTEEESEPAKPSNAPLTEEMATFTTLGLSHRLAAHLSTKMDMKAPTAIQKASIQQMIHDDSDAFIQAETGSGKTLAYLLPIVERIMAMSSKDKKVHRNSGLFALVLAPTRELCKQIATVLEKVLRCAPWIVGTTVIGGESKQSEKARLRKGINILIATPGRLADHLDNTEVLNVSTVRWLVLDEGDRLMELGFEEEIKGIVEKIRKRAVEGNLPNESGVKALPDRRVTVLCSATMKTNVQKLGEISLTDAVHIKADPSEEQAAKNKLDGIDDKDRSFSAPAQLKQAYAIVPAKQRLVTLAAILKHSFARRGSVMKTIVFMSCSDSVNFHFALFSRPPEDITEEAPEDNKKDSKKKKLPAAPEASAEKVDITKDTISQGHAFSTPENPVTIYRWHGFLSQKERTATLKAFTESTDPGVLICTDVGSRGLDLPIDYVIEYDPPCKPDDHLHRVGRTARAGRNGRALIFLLPGEEEEYVSTLAAGYRDGTKSLTHNTAAELLRKGFGGIGDEWEERATAWQLATEHWLSDSPKYLTMAQLAFKSHIAAYTTHIAAERHIFDKARLHLGHLAKAFGLRDKPGSINVPGVRTAKMTRADKSVAARKAKRGEVDEKAVEGQMVLKKRKAELDMPRGTVDGEEAAKRMKKKMMEHMAVASEFNIG